MKTRQAGWISAASSRREVKRGYRNGSDAEAGFLTPCSEPRHGGVRAGFTLMEILVAMSIMILAGAGIVAVFHVLLTLSVKNSAVNLTHQQGLKAISRISNELRSSVSIPQLIDTSFNTVSPGLPAAGVRFQTVFRGPNQIHNNCNSASKNVRITVGQNEPREPLPGMRLIIPAVQLEAPIHKPTAVPGNSGIQDIQLENRFGTYTDPPDQDLDCNNGDPVFLTYITQRSAFLIVDGDLRYYPHYPDGKFFVLVRNITTPKPFSFVDGNTQSVRVSIVTFDPRSNRRGYRALDLTVNASIPNRFRLTKFQ